MKVHMDKSTESSYVMILGRYLLKFLVTDINIFNHRKMGGVYQKKGCIVPIVYLNYYNFKPI